jgi:hypothetical protein
MFFQNLNICTAESITLLCTSQRSQCLRCAHHSGVNDSAVHVTAESVTPLKFFKIFIIAQRSQWLRCASHSRVNDSAVHVTAESVTLLCMSQRSRWLRCDKTRRLQSRFSRRILIHIEKGFNPCLRGLGGVVWWKTRGRKSRVRVPLRISISCRIIEYILCSAAVLINSQQC